MIFRQWRQVLDGTKTQTRRLVKIGDCIHKGEEQLWYMMRSDPQLGSMVRKGRCQIPTVVLRFKYKPYRIKWQVGRTYAVQPGRGKKAVGRIRLLEIRQERLQDISEEDALAEGVTLVGMYDCDYIPAERSLGDERWFAEQQRVSGFRGAYAMLWDKIHRKRQHEWLANPHVWVLTFEVMNNGGG